MNESTVLLSYPWALFILGTRQSIGLCRNGASVYMARLLLLMAGLLIAITHQPRVWWHSLAFYLSSHYLSIEIDAHTWCRIMTCTGVGKSLLMYCLPVLIGEAEPFDPSSGLWVQVWLDPNHCGCAPSIVAAHLSNVRQIKRVSEEWSGTMATATTQLQ